MQIWQFILFIICWIPIEYLCIYWSVKQNPDLFYSLHQTEIIRVLNKLEKKKSDKK